MGEHETRTRATYHHGDLRRALLDRAAAVIAESGIEAISLRSLARDLGVSHGAPNRHFRNKGELLSALATLAYEESRLATLGAAEGVDDPWVRLNAMGRGFLRWALKNRSLFQAMGHPDINRHAQEDLLESMARFRDTLRDASLQAQAAGRHPDYDPRIVALYTNAVPFGAAMLIGHPVFAAEVDEFGIESLIEQVIELVVPIRGRIDGG